MRSSFKSSSEKCWREGRCKLGICVLAACLAANACDSSQKNTAPSSAPGADAGPGSPNNTLSPELAARVLARVGDTKITLGDFAAILSRMDQFERLRYQSPDRRKLLLDEIIKVELLAQEAKRRGLDKDPEVELRFRQALRDELKRDLLKTVPKPEEIPLTEVQAYYAAHRAEYADPERRRLSHIELATQAKAEEVLRQALKATPEKWGALVLEFSLDKKTASESEPPELRGDLGIVSRPGEKDSAASVPDALKHAVFEIGELGGVLPKVVSAGGHFHIVRLTGKTEARSRSLAEAERTIRVALVQERIKEKEATFEAELRKRYPVKIDAEELAALKLRVESKANAPTGTAATNSAPKATP